MNPNEPETLDPVDGAELGPASSIDDAGVVQAVQEYLAALEAGRKPERVEFLRRYPEIAEALAECLEGLEFLHQAAPNLSDAGASALTPAAEIQPATPLGDFRIVREIGRGGMGVVYEAQQLSLGRRVALKVLPFAATLDSKQLQRFKTEAQAAAHLQHQNIVPVYAIGCERGVHYYAMQFIDGQTLAALIGELRQLAGIDTERALPTGSLANELVSGQWAPHRKGTDDHEGRDSRAPSPAAGSDQPTHTVTRPAGATPTDSSHRNTAYFRTVAGLGVQAAEALEHSHRLGVVHRDIKPANLLVDVRGNLWVTDFGVARLGVDTGLTLTGDLVGTVRYMSPEQALGRHVLVDHHTDIYSLGVTLFELLTLEPAFSGHDRHELLRQIAYDEPRAPRRLNSAIPAELETIVLKAMAKVPAERYATAQELADDLQRFLDDKPIKARRPSLWERATKFARRHRPLVLTVASATATVLIVLALGATIAAVRLGAMAQREGRAAAQAKLALANEEQALGLAQQANQKEVALRHRAEELAEESRGRLVRLYIVNGARTMDEGDLPVAFTWFTEAMKLDKKDAAREEIHRLRLAAVLSQYPKLVQVWFHAGPVLDAEFSPDGRRVVTASHDHTARVWDVATGQPVTPPLKHGDVLWCASFSPNGQRVVTASHDGTARVWDASTGQEMTPPLAHDRPVRFAAFSPDDSRVVTASEDWTARVWDAVTGQPRTPPLKHGALVKHAAFSPDGRYVVTASFDRTARVWNASTGEPVTDPLKHGGKVYWAMFSPDGRRVVTATHGWARVWNVPTGEPVTALEHNNWVSWAGFSPDGRRVATSCFDSTARVWDAETGSPTTPRLRQGGSLNGAAFSPDGKLLITFSRDHTARVWDASTGALVSPILRHNGALASASFSPDGRYVVTASEDETARVWDLGSAEQSTTRLPHAGLVFTASFSPDGRRVVTGGSDGSARVWNATTGEPVTPLLKHGATVWQASFSPDGRRVVTASDDQSARVWDAATGKPVTAPLLHRGWVRSASFSPDGRRVVTASHDQTAQVWDVGTGSPIGRSMKHSGAVHDASFSPDGSHVVTASSDGARLWDAATGMSIDLPMKHGDGVLHASFSPDGRRVVAHSTNEARVWNVANGEPVTPSLKHDVLRHVSWSRDGCRVLTAGADQTARIWNADTGEPITPALRHPDSVWNASFSPDGRRLVTACLDHNARLWELPVESRRLDELVLIAQALSGLQTRAPDQFGPLETGPFQRTWATLSSKYPRDFPASPLVEVLNWEWKEHFRQGCDHAGASQWEQAIAEFTQAIALGANDTRLWCERGLALQRLKQWEKAAADFTRVLEVRPVDAPALAQRAQNYLKLQVWEKARSDYTKLVELTPDDPNAWYGRALASSQLGEWNTALADFTRAIELDPKGSACWAGRGYSHAVLGRLDEASEDFAEALKRNSDDSWIWFHTACQLLHEGKTGAYQRHCELMIEHFKEANEPWTVLVETRTRLLAPCGAADPARLISVAEKALAAHPKDVEYLNVVAIACYRAGQLDEAARWARAALECDTTLDGRHVPSWLVLAMVHYRRGDLAEAQQWLDKAVRWIDETRDDQPRGSIADLGRWWGRRLEAKLMRREAEALFGQASSEKSP